MLSLESFKQVWGKQFPATNIKNNHFLIAVSGGLDSIVLAYLMHQIGAKCTIAHVNFQLRGAESERDENFVRSFSSKWNIPLFVHKSETTQYAQTNKMGIQEAAREIRYAWFDTIMKELAVTTGKPIFLLTAHHADDQVETVLMQLFRGTGLHGLTGIPARRNDSMAIIRPLLSYTKAQLAAFAQANSIQNIEDSSNTKNDYTRNLIRNKLIPEIEAVYPNVTQNIVATVERLKEAAEIVNTTIDAYWKKGLRISKGILFIPIVYWEKVITNQTYTWGLIKNFGFKASQIEEVVKLLHASDGAYIETNTHRFIKWKAQIQLVANDASTEHIIINKEDVEVQGKWQNLHFHIKQINELVINPDTNYAYLDADLIQWPLLLRTWQSPDYFYPLGLRKKKKLNHFLGSLKLSPTIKARITLLTTGDKILWVIGKRIDDRFKVTNSTKEVLVITCIDNP
ncbi:MAG: tRNA lysidine(34) synthetase TilS [Bacteroidota bacterium]|jgi:tRNA(Ile)-lysidine synthase